MFVFYVLCYFCFRNNNANKRHALNSWNTPCDLAILSVLPPHSPLLAAGHLLSLMAQKKKENSRNYICRAQLAL